MENREKSQYFSHHYSKRTILTIYFTIRFATIAILQDQIVLIQQNMPLTEHQIGGKALLFLEE